jgi:dTDP-4-amino-4,6-dideoxygalactose transaminase
MNMIQMLDLRAEYEYMKSDIDTAIQGAMMHQTWILGPEVKELEGKIAEYLKVKYCIGVASGTDALVLALRAFALKEKGREYFETSDEIITTAFTFTATGDAILRAGATPVFIDINPLTFNIDINKIKEYLKNNGARVKGIIPVHLYGQACDMDEIMALAGEKELFVLEDVAQAFGGEWRGQKLGSMGDAGALSFFPSKNLGCFGDGGAVTTNDTQIAEIVRQLMKHGGKDKYNVDHIGYNSRLDTLQAAILLAKIKYLDEFNNKRILNAQIYDQKLSRAENIVIPHRLNTAKHVFHQYTIRVKNGLRDKLAARLADAKISSMVYYPVPLHKMKVFDGRSIIGGKPEESEKAAHEVLSLPVGPTIKENEINKVSSKILEDE